MTQNSNNQDFTNNADGFALGGGTTERILTVTGGNATITGAGSAVVTLPTSTSTLATLALTETLTNKTLTSPVINTPTGIVKADVGLGNVDNTSNVTERAATATLTNKTLTSPVISSIVNTGTLTLPTSTDTLVGRATTDTLTNKDLTSTTNTFPYTAPQIGTNSTDITATTTPTLITSCTITVPTGKSVKITGSCSQIYNSTAANPAQISLWRGAASTGTHLGGYWQSTMSNGFSVNAIYIDSPGAGSFTYTLAISAPATTAHSNGASSPNYIFAEIV